MKSTRLFGLIGIGILLASSVACGTTTAQVTSADYPAWFLKPTANCATAAYQGGTMNAAVEGATQAARSELGKQLRTKVMSMTERSIRNVAGTGFDTAPGQEFLKVGGRTLSKEVVSGSRLVQKQPVAATGEWIVEVCLDHEKLAELAKNQAAAAAKQILDANEKVHNQVVQDMDAQLDKEFQK